MKDGFGDAAQVVAGLAGAMKRPSPEPGIVYSINFPKGTEAATQGSRNGAHLHYELRIDDRYLGEGLSADEIRELATRIFGLGN